MAAQVYFADMRAGIREDLHTKLERLTDQACADLVNQARGLPGRAMRTGHEPGCDKFRKVHPQIDWEAQQPHGETVDLGQRAYKLTKLEPGKK